MRSHVDFQPSARPAESDVGGRLPLMRPATETDVSIALPRVSTSRGRKHQQLCSARVHPQQHLTPVHSFFFLLHILQLSFFSYWVGLLCFVSPLFLPLFFSLFFLFFFVHLSISSFPLPLPSSLLLVFVCVCPFAVHRLSSRFQIASPCAAYGCVFNLTCFSSLFGPAERKGGRERTEGGRGERKKE